MWAASAVGAGTELEGQLVGAAREAAWEMEPGVSSQGALQEVVLRVEDLSKKTEPRLRLHTETRRELPSVKTHLLTQRQVSRLGLCTGHRSRGSWMGVWDGPRGPGMHLWDRSGCSRVRGRWWARLWGYADYPSSRWDILNNEEGIENQEK